MKNLTEFKYLSFKSVHFKIYVSTSSTMQLDISYLAIFMIQSQLPMQPRFNVHMESYLSLMSNKFLNLLSDKFSMDSISGSSSYQKIFSFRSYSSMTELLEVSILYCFQLPLMRNSMLKEKASKTEFFKLYMIGSP